MDSSRSGAKVGNPDQPLQRVAGGQDVAGVASQRKPVVHEIDVPGGDGAGRAQERLVARLQREAGVQGAGVDGAGGLRPQPAVEFDLQAEELLQRCYGASLRMGLEEPGVY
jgi:hypothetical protein